MKLIYKDEEENIPNFDDIFKDDEEDEVSVLVIFKKKRVVRIP